MNQNNPAGRPGNRNKAFGDGGMVTLGILSDVIQRTRLIKGALVLPDKHILLSVTLETRRGFGQYGLVRLTPDGSLDPRFINGGMFTSHFKGEDASSGGMLLRLADGRLLMLGSNITYPGGVEPLNHLAMACYRPDYTLDKTFGGNGTGHLVIENQPEEVCVPEMSAVAQQADGRLLISTTYHKFGDFTNTTGVLFRLNVDGTFDESFGKSGRLDFKLPGSIASTALTACLPQADGKIVVAGHAFLQPEYETALIARFDDKGVLDSEFGNPTSPGYVSMPIAKLPTRFNALLSTKRGFVGVGEAGGWKDPSTAGMLVGITKNGLLDSAFNKGKALLTKYHPERNNAWLNGYVQTDGKLVTSAGRHYLYISRFEADGQFDKGFGIDGGISEDTQCSGPVTLLDNPENKFLLACNTTGQEGGIGTVFDFLG